MFVTDNPLDYFFFASSKIVASLSAQHIQYRMFITDDKRNVSYKIFYGRHM